MPYMVHPRPDKIREACERLGWDVHDLASASERSPATIYRVLAGAQPGPEFIAACAAIFGEEALAELFYYGHSHDKPIEPPAPRKHFAPRLAQRGAA